MREAAKNEEDVKRTYVDSSVCGLSRKEVEFVDRDYQFELQVVWRLLFSPRGI